MAREHQLIDEIRQPGPPKYEITESTHEDVLVDTIIEFLRQSFARHPIYTYVPRQDNSYGPDWNQTKIAIVDKYTEDALFLPIVTMSVNSVNTHWIQFMQSPFQTVLKFQMNHDGSIKRDALGDPIPSHWEYVGAYDSTITLLISTEDTISREELANTLHIMFAEIGRDTLYMRGVFVKTVSVGGQSEQEYRNDYLYQQTVNIDIYSEWKRKIPVGDTLLGIGYTLNVVAEEEEPVETITVQQGVVFDRASCPYIVDPNTGESFMPLLELSATTDATTDAAPVTLTFNLTYNNWTPSEFWITAMQETSIPFTTLEADINKPSATSAYLKVAAIAIIQAIAARALATTQGTKFTDGTISFQDIWVYTDGTVELRSPNVLEPTIYNIRVQPDNTVIMRRGGEQSPLVASDVILDAYGDVVSGNLYKRTSAGDVLVVSNELILLDGGDYTTMSAVDLFMIMIYGSQPYRFSLNTILQAIDGLLTDLSNTNIVVAYRMAKTTSITFIKQQLLDRSESYLLQRPVGY